MIHIITSDFRNEYKKYVKKVISLPHGIEQYFTYDEKYVDKKLLDNPEDLIGKEALVLYKKKENDVDQIFPVRIVKITKIEKIEDIVNIFFENTDKYWYPPKDISKTSDIISNLVETFYSHKNGRVNKFVFDDDLDKRIKFSTSVKRLLETFIEDPPLGFSVFTTSPGTGNTLYTIEVLDHENNPVERKNGMFYFVPSTQNSYNILKVRILFHSKKVSYKNANYTKTFYISANRIIFPIDYYETDLRDGIVYFKGIAKSGFDYLKIDVDNGYSIEVPIVIEEKHINEKTK